MSAVKYTVFHKPLMLSFCLPESSEHLQNSQPLVETLASQLLKETNKGSAAVCGSFSNTHTYAPTFFPLLGTTNAAWKCSDC